MWKYFFSAYAFYVGKIAGSFPFPPPPALLTKLLFPPPSADMLSWAVWFKFLLHKVIANTCLFILTSFSKQSASWKVLEICELSSDSRKTYSVNKYMYTGSSSYSFDNPLGGGGEETEKTQIANCSFGIHFFIIKLLGKSQTKFRHVQVFRAFTMKIF